MLIFACPMSNFLNRPMKTIERTRNQKIWQPIRVLSIAGSDSGGGAGIQADIKTISALGGYPASAISAITVQNTVGVEAVYPVGSKAICEQVEAVCKDLNPQAVKISMLPDPETAPALAEILLKYHCKNIVIDPVMVSTSGHTLSESPAMESMVKYLFPLSSIVTPNLEEARKLSGIPPIHIEKYRQAALKILEYGPEYVLIKGGHSKSLYPKDLLIGRKNKEMFCFSTRRVKTQNLHGTGCTLSAAIAFFLAAGLKVPQAVCKAKEYLYLAIKAGSNMKIGHGNGPVNHFYNPVPMQKSSESKGKNKTARSTKDKNS